MMYRVNTRLSDMKGLLRSWKCFVSVLHGNCRKPYSTEKQCDTLKEKTVNVKNVMINCVEVGQGTHPVLLLPGAIGSIWTDFEPQITQLKKDKFRIVAWDPPGYGKSRPPDRTFPLDFFQRDASLAHDLMKTLGHKKFSLVGWSDGGITALIMASFYPDSIKKLVVVGGNAYIKPEELEVYESIRNIDKWSEKMKAPLVSIYGEEYFRRTWSQWVDAMHELYKARGGDLCKDALPNIKCPTLIVHGARDVMVHGSHCIYLRDHILGAKLKIFEHGSHNLHLRYYQEFNTLITDFLSETSNL